MSEFFNLKFVTKFIVTLVGLGVIAGLFGFILVFFGAIPLAANKEDPKFLYHIVHSTFKRWVAANAGDVTAPDDLDDEGRIALGAQHFAQNCVRCHGAPGIGQNPMVLAMKPSPQHLPAVIDQFTDEELFVILDRGVMMSAMPAWPVEGRDDEVWTMVSFIRQLDEMTPEQYLALVTPDTAAAPTMAFGTDVDARPLGFYVDRYPMEEHLYSAPTGGFADYALAGVPVAQCSTCHGAAGNGAPTQGEAPNLTIQTPEYLKAALNSYSSGSRHSAYMQVVAAQLSADQVDALATYYGDTLPAMGPVMETAPDATLIAAGEELATQGRPVDGISACYDCHGLPDVGNDAILIPALAGQAPAYLENQLHQFRGPGRGHTSVWSPMMGVAHGLTDEDITAVSAYFAAKAPGEMAPPQGEDVPATTTQIAYSQGEVERVCATCHQSDLRGRVSDETPNLTLQGPDYVERQLYDFRANRRDNSRMHQAALRLEEDNITALAAYIGGLEPTPRATEASVDGDMALGEQIVQNGLPDQGVPACLTCHGAPTTTQISQIPHLNAQNGFYIQKRLMHFKNTDNDDLSGYSPMGWISKALTDEQIAATSAWFEAQQPLPK